MILLIASLALIAPPAAVPPPATTRTFVEMIAPRLPAPFSPDTTLVGARAEGDLLVLTVEATAGRLAALTPAGVEGAVASAFCATAFTRSVMAGPPSLRVDTRVPGGQTLTGRVLDACPLLGADGPLPPPRP